MPDAGAADTSMMMEEDGGCAAAGSDGADSLLFVFVLLLPWIRRRHARPL